MDKSDKNRKNIGSYYFTITKLHKKTKIIDAKCLFLLFFK